METLKDSAQAYEPPTTRNVTELEKIPVNVELHSGKGTKKDGTDFSYKYIKHEDIEYRVPGTVLGGIKSVLKKYPNTQYVTVDKEGEGMNTKYHVMPYVEDQMVEEEKVVSDGEKSDAEKNKDFLK